MCVPQKNIFKCALFMTYFPVLTSGPFVRYNNMQNELYDGHKLKEEAHDAYIKMARKAKENNISLIANVSYRSYESQEATYDI